MLVQHCECTKCHWILHFKMVKMVILGYVYHIIIKIAIKKNKNKNKTKTWVVFGLRKGFCYVVVMESERMFPNLKREGLVTSQFFRGMSQGESCPGFSKWGSSSGLAFFQPKCIIVTSVLCSFSGGSPQGKTRLWSTACRAEKEESSWSCREKSVNRSQTSLFGGRWGKRAQQWARALQGSLVEPRFFPSEGEAGRPGRHGTAWIKGNMRASVPYNVQKPKIQVSRHPQLPV